MSRFLTILALALTATVAVTQAQTIKCGAKGEAEVDDIVSKIMTIGTTRKYPTNKAELKTFCKGQTTYIGRLEEYKNNCLDKRSKQVVSIIIYSIKSLINTYCKHPNAKRTTDLLAAGGCANLATMEYNKCQIEYTERLINTLASTKDPKEMLGQMCCGYVGVHHCIRTKGNAVKGCEDKHVETHVQYNKGFFDNAVDVICGDYNDTSDKCERVKPMPGSKKKGKTPKSFFNPLVKVLSNL